MAIRFAPLALEGRELRRTVATPLICTTRKVAGPTGEALIADGAGLAVPFRQCWAGARQQAVLSPSSSALRTSCMPTVTGAS
jgi:hypothetical protein